MGDDPVERIELHAGVVWVHNLALIETKLVDILADVIAELIAVIDYHPTANLRHVLISPSIDLRRIVTQAIYRLSGPGQLPLDALLCVSKTESVPVDIENALTTYLVANEDFVHTLTVDNAHSVEVIANVLGALLHASIHGLLWDRTHASIPIDVLSVALDEPPPPPAPPPIVGPVRGMASELLESYLVFRRKIALMASNPLICVEGELRSGIPRHPYDIAHCLDRACDELRTLIYEAACRHTDGAESWVSIRRTLFRGILEPLARHTAYIDHTPGNATLAAEPAQSRYYVATLCPFWSRVHPELTLAYAKDEELIPCLNTIEAFIRMLLPNLGITLIDCGANNRYEFDRRWSG